MKNLTTLNKILYYLLYLALSLHIIFISVEEYINRKLFLFFPKNYQTSCINGIVKWRIQYKNNNLYIVHTKDNEKILLKTKYHWNIFDEIEVIISERCLDIYDSYENYLYNNFYVNKISYVLEVLETKRTRNAIHKLFSCIFEKLNRIRENLIKIIDNNLTSDISRSIAKRLSLGYKDLEVEDLETFFQEAGVAHVLVVSGLHVGFIYLLIKFLLKFLPYLPIEVKEILSLLGIFLYMLLTGCDIPVVRATIMISCFIISFLLRRKSSFYHTISTAAFILLLVNPRSIFSLSFQLSFLVCFGIFYFYNFFNILFSDFLNKQIYILRYLMSLLFVTISAQIAVAGLTIFYFNKFSAISVISNLIVVPYTSVLLWMNLGCYLLSFVFRDFSIIFWRILDFLFVLYFKIVKFFAKLPFSNLYISLDAIKVLLYYCLILILPMLIIHKKKNFIISFLALWLLGFFVSFNINKNFEVIFFDVGLGDSIFVKTEDNVRFLIDTPQNSYIANKKLKPYLINVKKIDFLIITHPHYVHYGATDYILENFNVKTVIIPDFFYEDYNYEDLIKKIKDKNIKLEVLSDKKLIKFKNGKVKIIKNTSKENLEKYILADKNSLIIKFYYKDKMIFLTNDAPSDNIIKHIEPDDKILILQIPQHGKYPAEVHGVLTHLKSLNKKAKINIVSTDEINFDVSDFNSLIFSTDKWKNIRVILSDCFSEKIKDIKYIGFETKVRI